MYWWKYKLPYSGIWLRAEIFANELFRLQKKCTRSLYLWIRGVYWIVSHTCACVWCDRRLLLHPLLLSMSVSFTVDSMIWGNHIYKLRLFGTAILVKNLMNNSVVCRCERNNIHDPFAVALLKSDVIISHVPRAISAACYVQYNQLQLIM